VVDALRRDDIERARRTVPAERAKQALALMSTGIRLKRAALRARHPTESEIEIAARLRRWLAREDG
jgi:hypothetical protein